MASQILQLNSADVLLVATDTRVRELTEYGSDARQTRNGVNLIGFSALAIAGGSALGIVQVSTGQRDLALTGGLLLAAAGTAEATFSGTDSAYGLRCSVFIERVEPTAINGWALLAESLRRVGQAVAK